MDTEKRLILCFALSMLIIFAFSWLNPKKTPPPGADRISSGQSTSTPSSSTPTGKPVVTPVEIAENPSTDTTVETTPAESVSTASWQWLPAEFPQDSKKTVVVESPLYRVEISTQGAIPVSWKLLQFKELLEDRRYLELQSERGSSAQKQLAELELDLLDSHKDNGPHYVEAIDSLFSESKAGYRIRWGKNRSDESIPYTCASDLVTVSEPTPVTFVFESNGVRVEKIFRFFPDSYHLEMDVRIVNQSEKEITFDENNQYYDIVWNGGFGFPSFRKDAMNNVLIQEDGSTSVKPIASVAKDIGGNAASWLPEYQPSQMRVLADGKNVGWIGVGQKYFMAAIVPKTPTQLGLEGITTPGASAMGDLKPSVGVRQLISSLPVGGVRQDKYILYVGPINEDDLAVPGEGLEDARQIFLRSVIGPIEHIMLRLLQGMYKVVPNYGFAIIVLTLLMKVLMFPIYQKQIRTTKKMQALQPQINALKEKYKNDQQKLQKEQMELFRKHKVNPLSGCLTMLTTIPVFIALYATFAMAVELRGAPFIGWIHDLSAPDGAFFLPLGSYIIPVNILPVAYAVLMFWNTSQQSMEGPNAAAMKILPLIFVFFFWSIASGVILYFVISIFIDVTQRTIMDKLKGDELTPAKAAKTK